MGESMGGEREREDPIYLFMKCLILDNIVFRVPVHSFLTRIQTKQSLELKIKTQLNYHKLKAEL